MKEKLADKTFTPAQRLESAGVLCQLDGNLYGVPEDEVRKTCALNCLAMQQYALEIPLPEGISLYEELPAHFMGNIERTGEGRSHIDLVSELNGNEDGDGYRIISWRRNYAYAVAGMNQLGEALRSFEKEGYDKDQLDQLMLQILNTSTGSFPQERAAAFMKDITDSVEAGYPVTVSFKEGYDGLTSSHQVIVVGCDDSGLGYTVVDPMKRDLIEMTREELANWSRCLAIFYRKIPKDDTISNNE